MERKYFTEANNMLAKDQRHGDPLALLERCLELDARLKDIEALVDQERPEPEKPAQQPPQQETIDGGQT